MYNHAVVATKAYPLHYGHIHVIEQARRQSKRVTVFVVYGHHQSPNGLDRAAAVQRTFPDVDVVPVVDIYTDDNDPQSSIYWGIYTKDIMKGVEFDAVFGSEPYIRDWAYQLHATPVEIDTRRSLVPISGTEIRENPMANWSYIAPEFRPFYLNRVLIVGAESTGKTTLAKNLAEHYSTRFVPEWGRIFVEQNFAEGEEITPEYKRVTFASILNNQPRIEDEIERLSHRVCFFDTDLFTTALWFREWQENSSLDPMMEHIIQISTQREKRYDLVILLDHREAAWRNDGYREQTDDIRERFTDKLSSHFNVAERHHNLPLIILGGPLEERTPIAIDVVDALLSGEL